MGRYTLADDIARMAAHVAVPDAHTYNMLEVMGTGQYLFTPFATAVTHSAVAAALLIGTPFPFVITKNVDRVGVNITVAAGAGNKLRVGIYEDNGLCYPGALVPGSEGELAADDVALVAVIVALTLARGLYWVAYLSQSNPAVSTPNQGIAITGSAAVPAVGSFNYLIAQAYGALPDPFPAGAVPTWWGPTMLRFA